MTSKRKWPENLGAYIYACPEPTPQPYSPGPYAESMSEGVVIPPRKPTKDDAIASLAKSLEGALDAISTLMSERAALLRRITELENELRPSL